MLKSVLLANALSCLVFGFMFVFMGPETSEFMGSPPVLLIQVLGAGLVVNAGLLIAASIQAQPSRDTIMMFVLGDVAWVIATVLLIFLGIWITTTSGIVWSLAVGTFVGLCALLQCNMRQAESTVLRTALRTYRHLTGNAEKRMVGLMSTIDLTH